MTNGSVEPQVIGVNHDAHNCNEYMLGLATMCSLPPRHLVLGTGTVQRDDLTIKSSSIRDAPTQWSARKVREC